MFCDLFLINFSRWNVIVLSFIPSLINIAILVYTALFSPKTRVNIFFSVFVFTLALWQCAYGFMRMSDIAEHASQFHRLSEILVLFVIFSGNLFVFRFTGFYQKISNNLIFVLFVVPLTCFFVILYFQLDVFIIKTSQSWYWIANPLPNAINLSLSIWVSLGALFMLILLWYYSLKSNKGSIEQKKFYLLRWGIGFPVVGGVIAEVILPIIFKIDSIPIANTLITTFSITSIIVISKYKMLDFSPKHQWEKIIETLNEGILIVNNRDRIMFANRAFCELTKYKFSEINGMAATELFLSGLEQKQQFESPEERKTDEFSHNQLEMKTKTGEKICMIVSASPYTDRRGRTVGSIRLYTNISQIKEAKENLKLANDELEIYVYKASHDLRGPLASILGLINVGRLSIKDQNSKELFNMLETAATRLDLTLSELVKGMKIKDVHVFDDIIDFEEIIKDVLKMFNHFPGYNWVKISIDVSVSKDFISNRFIIETIFQNLIENAIKYQKLNDKNSFLKINVLQDGDKIDIRVEDNGIGIEKSIQNKIFDMYFRGTDASSGTGLGLYLVKKSVEKLKGELNLSSTLGKGTTFQVFLNK